jgi:hypothetical protein
LLMLFMLLSKHNDAFLVPALLFVSLSAFADFQRLFTALIIPLYFRKYLIIPIYVLLIIFI